MLICNQLIYTISSLHVKKFKTEFQNIVHLAQAFKGCNKYDFFQFDENREEFLIIEIFKSEKSEKKFKLSQEYINSFNEIKGMIESISTHPLRLTTCLTKQNVFEP